MKNPFLANLACGTILLLSVIRVQVLAQSIDPNTIDFSTAPGWENFAECVRTCLNCEGWGCSRHSAKTISGCKTNECLCSPSHLFTALKTAYSCGVELCKDYSDAKIANDTVMAYCSERGYTKVMAPVTAGEPSASACATFTVTVTALLTSEVTDAVKRSGGSVSSRCRISCFLHVSIC